MPHQSTNLLTDRMWPTLVAHHGALITYDRAGVTHSLTAVKGRRSVEVAGTDYSTTTVADEWFFLASDMIDAGLTEAERADFIRYTDPNSRPQTCEVHLPGGRREWSYVDNEGAIVQVFTLQVAE